MTHVNCNNPKNALYWQQYFFSVFTSCVSFDTVTYCYKQSLPHCITCYRCLRSTVTMQQNAYRCNLSEPLLPCYCYAIKANFKTILPQVSQPASVGNVADLVNCKLISHHCMMPEQWIRLLCSVSVILANETVIARIKSIKLLTLGILEIFGS